MWTGGIRPTLPVASELSKSTSIYFGVFCQKWDENALLIQLCFSNWHTTGCWLMNVYECLCWLIKILWMFLLTWDEATLTDMGHGSWAVEPGGKVWSLPSFCSFPQVSGASLEDLAACKMQCCQANLWLVESLVSFVCRKPFDQYYKDTMVLNSRYPQFLWQFIYK
jgi:hypothetical protein